MKEFRKKLNWCLNLMKKSKLYAIGETILIPMIAIKVSIKSDNFKLLAITV